MLVVLKASMLSVRVNQSLSVLHKNYIENFQFGGLRNGNNGQANRVIHASCFQPSLLTEGIPAIAQTE